TQSGSIVEELEVRGEDMEGIAWHPEYETLWVVEERQREIIEYDTLGQILSRFQVDVERRNENDGLEGIAINTRNHHIFVANEKNPRRLVELDAQGNQLRKVPVDFGLDDEARGLDLSGLHYDDVHDWLWLISDEARAIFVIDPDGRPLAAFQSDVQDLEGITVLHEQQRIAAVSDDLQRLVYFDLPDPLLHLPRRVGTSTSAAR
ncbi:SdiA-regulated domain-containing protein, partial [Balneolaceae bacterium ANBcel3]|nr:SdiA-regulated domain-containing protein [Balneolaceae bacterium ANBcel3]